MRKTALYVAGWFAAGIGAVTLATAGVSMVGRQVTGERPSSLSAQEVRAELGRDAIESDTSTTTPSTSTTTPTTTVPGAGAGPGTDGASGSGSGEVGRAGSSTDPSPTGVGSTAPAAGAPGPDGDDSDDDAPVTTSTAPAPAPSETRTYSMTGGTATLRFSSTGVTVVVATPNAGFSVEQEPTHDNGVRVEFRSDEHRSRVEGWWDGGPRDEVEEGD